MLKDLGAVRATARQISEAISGVVEALRAGRVEHEPAFTDRMLQAIETRLDGKNIHGVHWQAKTLTDRGRDSQERLYGADFMGVLSIDLPGYRATKGFLAQAKLVRGRSTGTASDLVRQCNAMLELSPMSFVFLYGPSGVEVASATAVVGAGGRTSGVYKQSTLGFFEDHLKCSIGDQRIQLPHADTLKVLASNTPARSALVLQATSV
ncbi:MAG: hypothetical protein U0640_02125 [Phycisphaerales bacterium]